MAEERNISHVIDVDAAVTLSGLFRERVRRTPDFVAYRHYDQQLERWRDYTWREMDAHVARWQAALERDGLKAGDRIGIMLRNCPEWVMCDIAALGLGLVVVPLYTHDRPDNVVYMLTHSGCSALVFETAAQWSALASVREELRDLVRMVSIDVFDDAADPRLQSLSQWLPSSAPATRHLSVAGSTLATIVYTSGTTGRPKGVMLSHHNILSNAHACLTGVMTTGHDDVFLSFLPLSHTFERTCGYYLTMMAGSTTAYARSIQQLGEDLQIIRPTVLVSVPRIYERVSGAIRAKLEEGPPARRRLFDRAVEVGYARFEHAQGRGEWKLSFLLWPLLEKLVARKVLARLGGRLKVALSGGAALPPHISRLFIGLGLPVLQGYGMTECAPVACANRPDDNVPESIGRSIPDVDIEIGQDGALLIKGPNVMLGYWQNPEATGEVLSSDGWLNSGDLARIDEAGHVFITGRLKDIIVMSNGEKIAPTDVEAAILCDPLIEQVMLVGEARPFLSIVAVVNQQRWEKLAMEKGLRDAAIYSRAAQDLLLERVSLQLKALPGYAQVRRAVVSFDPWSVENGLLTPTMKLKRTHVTQKFNSEIEAMYAGH